MSGVVATNFTDCVRIDSRTSGKISVLQSRVFCADYTMPYSGDLNLAPMPHSTQTPVLDLEPPKRKGRGPGKAPKRDPAVARVKLVQALSRRGLPLVLSSNVVA